MLPIAVQEILSQARADQEKIVLVTGVFDVLHSKHLEFLHSAKKSGGVLVVGLEADVRVKQMKGEDRPYNSQDVRIKNLEQLNIADVVFILPEDFGLFTRREELIKEMSPTFLAVSSHSPHQKEKQALLEKYGGKVIVVTEFDPRFSTTQLLAKKQQEGSHRE